MPLIDAKEVRSRYVVGIDLGMTNCAAAYVDSTDPALAVRDLAIPQLVAPATIEPRETLPSFHYEAATGELGQDALRMPWDVSSGRVAVGSFARDHGALVPGRLISSAKSWLCNPHVDRMAGILPWHGAADVQRLSPVDVSARYLAHIRCAWDQQFQSEPLAQQDVILTVPASFDEVARELTVAASVKAGLSNVVLVEEPQAAFYAWLHEHRHDWEAQVTAGQTILICDIGGGTTDFTLIRVQAAAGGKVHFHRVAVGEHLILGGDNLDLALAHEVEKKISSGEKLDPRRWASLVRLCRSVKETLLGPNPPPDVTLHLGASGSKLIGGSTQIELKREEAQRILLEGFLPVVGIEARPAARQSGFQELGLPYAADAAISKYLAAFLTAHRDREVHGGIGAARPDIVLFNGGFFESPQLSARLLDILSGWFSTPGQPRWQPRVLPNARLDLAVSRGAAHYGMVRRGRGERISGGSAQTYYIGVESTDSAAPKVVCLLPAGLEEGQGVDLPDVRFELLIRQPAEFPLYVSSVRTTDVAGQIVAVDPLQMTALPPIRTVLQAGKKTADSIAVTLHARRTEIGTLELWCAELNGDRKWKLQFDVRIASSPGHGAHGGQGEAEGFVDQAIVEACQKSIRQTFGGEGPGERDRPEELTKRLESITALPRGQWPPSLMRSFWEQLLALEAGRRLSVEHELRWLNLLGYSLRPGYGLAVDDWRVAQTWKLQPSRVIHEKNEQCRAEWWVLWRRVAGGLTQGQQHTLAEPLIAALRTYLRKAGTAKGSPLDYGPHEGAEVFRLLGALELLKTSTKIELGQMLIQFVARDRAGALQDAAAWALGRIGARVPVYGPLNGLVPVEAVEQWIQSLIGLSKSPAKLSFAFVLMARLTKDRYRDISTEARSSLVQHLKHTGAPAHYVTLVETGGELAEEEQRIAFGESLPRGLRIQ